MALKTVTTSHLAPASLSQPTRKTATCTTSRPSAPHQQAHLASKRATFCNRSAQALNRTRSNQTIVGRRAVSCTAAQSEEEEPIYYTKNKQQKRAIQQWYDDLIGSEVKQVTADTFGAAVKEGYMVLDIRPQFEYRLAHIEGSLHVPFWVDAKLVKKTMKRSLGMMIGGSMSPSGATCSNVNFLEELLALSPDKNRKLLVCCMGGCRSLFAVKMLHDAGFTNLGWLDRGFYALDYDPEPGAKDGNGKLLDKDEEGPLTIIDGNTPKIVGIQIFGGKGRVYQLSEAVSTSFNLYTKDYLVYEGIGIYNKKVTKA